MNLRDEVIQYVEHLLFHADNGTKFEGWAALKPSLVEKREPHGGEWERMNEVAGDKWHGIPLYETQKIALPDGRSTVALPAPAVQAQQRSLLNPSPFAQDVIEHRPLDGERTPTIAEMDAEREQKAAETQNQAAAQAEQQRLSRLGQPELAADQIHRVAAENGRVGPGPIDPQIGSGPGPLDSI